MSDNYEVGYKRPPKNRQFRKGKSGHPLGRPKGARNLKTVMTEVLDRQVVATTRGKRNKVTMLRAACMAVSGKAAQGDMRAAALLFKIIIDLFEPEQTAQQQPDLTGQEEKILEDFLKQHSGGSKGDGA